MTKKLLLSVILCLSIAITAWAQNRTVSGKVTDSETGQGIPGVSVFLKGTTTGVVTDVNGSYQIDVPGGGTLVFQAVGMISQEVPVGSQARIDIQMTPDVKELGEVVVTGYGTTLKKEVTGSITSIKAEDIAKIPASNLQNALQGQSSGVFVTSTSGTPGGSISVRVRGQTSVNASNAPLYVIDGVPVIAGGLTQNAFGGQDQSALNGVNPQDIESIEILKDASVTAIYGARAANGVILITTKQGKKGKAKINANVWAGWANRSNTYDLASAQLYVDKTTEGRTAAGLSLPTAVTEWDGVTNVDLQEEVYQVANLYEAQLNVSGGSEAISYYISGSYRSEQATFIGGGIERYTGRVNLDYRPLGEKLSFSAKIGISTELNDRIENDNNIFGIVSTSLLAPGTIPIRDPETGEFNDILPGFGTNPVRAATNSKNDINTVKIISNVSANYEIIPGLNAIADFSIDFNDVTEDINVPATTAQGRGSNGSGNFAFRRVSTWVFEPRLNYRNTFAEDHTLSGTFGGTLLRRKDLFAFASGTGFAKPELVFLNSASVIDDGSSGFTPYSFNSLFGRVGYSYKEKYIFNASVRRDGSSRFGSGNKFGTFWSVSGAWNFADEEFLDLPWLEVGKLRVGYGVIGNDGIGDFTFTGFFGAGDYLGQPSFTRGGIENSELKWEETSTLDIGIELSFLGGRIDFSTTYFEKRTDDLLFNVPLPSTTGFNNVQSNIGETENVGWEFELGGTVLNVGGFQWTISSNLTLLQNKVVSLQDDEPIFAGFGSAVIVGKPIGTFYGLDWLGVNPATGNSEFRDLNGDGIIDTGNDQGVIGDANPDYWGGITTNFSYKGITLDILFQFVGGVDIYNNTRTFLMNPTSNFQLHDDIRFAWQNPGDITFVPRVDVVQPNDFSNDNSRWLENGDYLRLKNVTLAYDLPQSILSKIKLRQLRVYVTGFNLLTFTEYEGIDPEVSTFGFTDNAAGTEFLTAPQPITYTVGVNIGL